MAYLTLRAYSEIVYQPIGVRLSGREHIVGSPPKVPRWRRQAYRVVFSPLMVAEEEGRRLKDKGEGLVEEAGDYGKSYLPD